METEYALIREARVLFPGLKTKHPDCAPEYVVTRALYFRVQEQMRHGRWDEVGRVFGFLEGFCKMDPGWENPVRVEILEDFDFQDQEATVQRLMGPFLLGWYRSQRDSFASCTAEGRSERRAQRRAFDRLVFGTAPQETARGGVGKPVDQLTTADLKAFSIWEFASEEEGLRGHDETWVRPAGRSSVPLGVSGQLVAARFTTPGGRVFRGVMEVSTVQGRVDIQPGAIVRGGTSMAIPRSVSEGSLGAGRAESMRTRRRLLRGLGLRQPDLFPLKYRLAACVGDEAKPRQGVIG